MNNKELLIASVGILCGAFTIYFYGKKIGNNNLTWKHYAAVFSVFLIPTIYVPFWLDKNMTFWTKFLFTIFSILVLCARYFTTTKAQEAVAELVEDAKKTK